jgi:hypothetical protein
MFGEIFMKKTKSSILAIALILLFSLAGCLAAIPAGGLALGLLLTSERANQPNQESKQQQSKQKSQEKQSNSENNLVRPVIYNYAPIITLAWSSNSRSFPAGYKIYYKIDSTVPPYDGIGLAEGDSPIVIPLAMLKNPNKPEFTIHGLEENKTYFFAVTTFELNGQESLFSNGILVKPPEVTAGQ